MGFVPNSNVALLFILFLFWEDRTHSGCTGSSLLYHEDVVAVFFSVFLFGLRLRRILQVALLVKHTVCRAEHDEFGAAVKLVAYFLLLLVELLDVILRQHVTFLQPSVFLGEFLPYRLWLHLAVAYRRQSVCLYSLADEIFHHGLRTSLRQGLVICPSTNS